MHHTLIYQLLFYNYFVRKSDYKMHKCKDIETFRDFLSIHAIEWTDRPQAKSSFAIKKTFIANCIEVGIKFLFRTQLTYHACHPFFWECSYFTPKVCPNLSDDPKGFHDHPTRSDKCPRVREKRQNLEWKNIVFLRKSLYYIEVGKSKILRS